MSELLGNCLMFMYCFVVVWCCCLLDHSWIFFQVNEPKERCWDLPTTKEHFRLVNEWLVFSEDDIYNHTRTNIIWQYNCNCRKYLEMSKGKKIGMQLMIKIIEKLTILDFNNSLLFILFLRISFMKVWTRPGKEAPGRCVLCVDAQMKLHITVMPWPSVILNISGVILGWSLFLEA